jgi:phosphoserine phosphatase
MGHLPVGDPEKFCETAFTDHDKTLFNEVVLLEADPDIVLQRRKGAGLSFGQPELDVVKDEIAREREHAVDLCRETGARLRVIEANLPGRAVATLRGYLRSPASVSETYPMSHRHSIVRTARKYAKQVEGEVVFLFDADGTLSPVDVSEEFMKLVNNMPKDGPAHSAMHRNFKERGRSFASYLYHEIYHRDFSKGRFTAICKAVAAEVKLFTGVEECLLEALKVGRVAILTAGIPDIWKSVLAREGIEGVDIFGLVDKDARYVMDEQGKECFAQEVRRKAKRLIASGDSVGDLGMMRTADVAFMVVKWPDMEKKDQKNVESSKIIKDVEPSEITKMVMMLSRHPAVYRIKSKPEVYEVIGPHFATWADFVGLSLENL